jgi:hypothetical protein
MVVENHGLNEINLSGKYGALEEFERSPAAPCAALEFHRYWARIEPIDPLADHSSIMKM